MRKGKDPDPGGPKTCGSGSPTLFKTYYYLQVFLFSFINIAPCIPVLMFPANTYIHNLLVRSFVTFSLIFHCFLSERGKENRRENHIICHSCLFSFSHFPKVTMVFVYCDVHKVHWSPHSALKRPFNALHTTEWHRPLSCLHSIMIKLAQAGEGGGSTLFTITYKVAVYAPAERVDTLPLFSSLPICTLVLHTVAINLCSFVRDNSVTFSYKVFQYSFGVQDLQVSAPAVGSCLSLPQLQVQGPGSHQLGQARHVHRLQHHCPGAQGKKNHIEWCIL